VPETISSAFTSKSSVAKGHARKINLTGLLPMLSLEGYIAVRETHLSLEDLKSLWHISVDDSSGKIYN
jgi:hypothetical protein